MSSKKKAFFSCTLNKEKQFVKLKQLLQRRPTNEGSQKELGRFNKLPEYVFSDARSTSLSARVAKKHKSHAIFAL